MSMDRFSTVQDAQEVAVVAYCPCGAELYAGQEAYWVDGQLLCKKERCLVKFINGEVVEL